jgi:hypothetical protein
MIQTLSTLNLIPLSANYPYDNNIKLNTDSIAWKDGYQTFKQNVFDYNVDTSLNNDSIFYLTSSSDLFNIIQETPLDNCILGDYIVLQINSQYVTNVDNELYLTPVSSDSSYFRLIVNSDNTYSFLQGTGTYVTVSNQTPFDLTLESLLPNDELHHQKFNMNILNNSQSYITTRITNESGVGSSTIERYWSYTKHGPEQGKLRANGTTQNNDYLFTINNFDINFIPTGFTRDHTWVWYYNNFNDATNNKNVEINESKSISGIKINHLFDLPYNTKINIINNQMDVNFANMKTIQTPNYEYRKKI